METDRNIFIAFILNFAFSIFEAAGGIFTGSTAILSDAVHDMGDAASIGISWFLEKKSKKAADDKFTYGYSRYSVIGSIITLLILTVGSLGVMLNAVMRIFDPREINYDGMLVFAVAGVIINLIAAIFTRNGGSLNQKAVNLHMLEDVLGWLVVLVGAVIMRFTDLTVIDPLMSLGVAAFILISSVPGLKNSMDVLLDRAPADIDLGELVTHLTELDGVIGVHHLHVRTIDGRSSSATLHAVIEGDAVTLKKAIKKELLDHGIIHSTVEIETADEICHDCGCSIKYSESVSGRGICCHGHRHCH